MKLIAAAISGALLSIVISHCLHNYLYRGVIIGTTLISTSSSSSSSSQFTVDKYFSQDYYEARDKFRNAVGKHPKMELHSLKLNLNGEEYRSDSNTDDLTIDIALLARSQRKVLIHICGTHGVEGFPGSAIQNSLLRNDTMKAYFDHQGLEEDDSLPTIVFVHALNPYGFSNLRRFNENNVDLNRNFLYPNEFEKVKAGDPNHVGYVDMMDFINPTESFERRTFRWDFFFPEAFYAIARNGFHKMKQCIVTGNYHFPKTLFYGGDKLEQSHALLKEFLLNHLNTENLETVGILDVHSGLGKSGFDTIGLAGVRPDEASKIFGGLDHIHFADYAEEEAAAAAAEKTELNSDNALSGYDKVAGFLREGLTKQVFSGAKVYPVTQEFGTLPAILVFKAMRAENAMYQYDPKNRHPKYSQALRDAFYFDKNPEWKKKVISRGQEVFDQLYSHLTRD